MLPISTCVRFPAAFLFHSFRCLTHLSPRPSVLAMGRQSKKQRTMAMNNPMMQMMAAMAAMNGMNSQQSDSESEGNDRHNAGPSANAKAQSIVASSASRPDVNTAGAVQSSAPASGTDASSVAVAAAMQGLDQNRASLYSAHGDSMKITRSAAMLRALPKAGTLQI